MTIIGPEIPSPRANFGYAKAGDKIIIAGGRTSNFDPFLPHQTPFEVFCLDSQLGVWKKVATKGVEPLYSNGTRAAMLSSSELVVVTGCKCSSWLSVEMFNLESISILILFSSDSNDPQLGSESTGYELRSLEEQHASVDLEVFRRFAGARCLASNRRVDASAKKCLCSNAES